MEQPDQQLLSLIYASSPPTRINEGWIIDNSALLDIINTQNPQKGFRNFNDVFGFYSDHAARISQQAIIHLVTETVFNYPNNYLTEKTFKPIINKRPFLLAASPGCLRNLQDLGFKTFNKYWDESYDTITNPSDRIIAIINILESLCQQPFENLLAMLDDMCPILEHNYRYYTSEFKANELQKLKAQCQKNLLR